MIYNTPFQGSKSHLFRNQGAGTLGCLFFLVLIAILGYVILKFGEAGWDYVQVRQKSKEAMNWAVSGKDKSHTEIVQKVIHNALEAGIELTPRNVHVKETTDMLIMTVSWVREIDFPYYTYPLKLSLTHTDVKRWRRGGLIIK